MLRSICSALRNVTINSLRQNVVQTPKMLPFRSSFSHLTLANTNIVKTPNFIANPLQNVNSILFRQIEKTTPSVQPNRSVTKFSLRNGKRKSVKTVLKRFYRLNWGIWIRTKAGRHKRLWKKTNERKKRLKQHVFCNATQSHMLDKMVTKFWRKPKHFVDDIYAPYHKRPEFSYTNPKPVYRG